MLKQLRQENNLTQRKLSEIIGVKQSTVCMWELKKATPPINKIGKLAKALNVSEAEIIACFK